MDYSQRILAAEEQVNKASKEVDRARDELNSFKASQQVPPYFEGGSKEYFTFLNQQVKDRELTLKDRTAELITFSQLEIQTSSGNKRARSRSSQSGQLTQPVFRQRIVARDNVCVITGVGQEHCQAAHIVAQRNFTINDIQANTLWDDKFPGCCDNPEHRVMDVRNGLLLSNPLHTAFDNFEFTIRKDGDSYKVETQTLVGSRLIDSLNGRIVEFNPERRHEWPRDEFLQFHNRCFEIKSIALRAAAEECSDEEEYDERLESVKKSKIWLEQMVA